MKTYELVWQFDWERDEPPTLEGFNVSWREPAGTGINGGYRTAFGCPLEDAPTIDRALELREVSSTGTEPKA